LHTYQISLDDFERLLNLWRKLFILDDSFYMKILQELNLDSLDPVATYRYIIRFLELWGVRQSATQLDPVMLCNKIIELKPILNELKSPLLKADLEKLKDRVKYIFKDLESLKNVGPTSASKILHLLKPEFFIMWDRPIAEHYRLNPTAKIVEEEYCKFLAKMREILNTLLKECSRKYLSERPEEDLIRKYGNKPLTKLIDEYNWLKTRPWLNRLTKLTEQQPLFPSK